MARFENVKATNTSADPFEGLGVEDRLKKHIVDGIKKNLDRDLEEALEAYPPLDIINNIKKMKPSKTEIPKNEFIVISIA